MINKLLTSIGIYLFFWAVKTEQFDDLEKQGMSILFDEPINDNTKPLTKDNDKDKDKREQPEKTDSQ